MIIHLICPTTAVHAQVRAWCHMLKSQRQTVIVYSQHAVPCADRPLCDYWRLVQSTTETIDKIRKYRRMHFNVVLHFEYRSEKPDTYMARLGAPAYTHVLPCHDGGTEALPTELAVIFPTRQWSQLFMDRHTVYKSQVVLPWYPMVMINDPETMVSLYVRGRRGAFLFASSNGDGLPVFLEVARRCPLNHFWVIGKVETPLENVTCYMSDELRSLLPQAAAVIIPSLHVEPFSELTALATLYGTPVIAPNIAAFAEQVTQDITGALVNVRAEWIHDDLRTLEFTAWWMEYLITTIISAMPDVRRMSSSFCRRHVEGLYDPAKLGKAAMRFISECTQASWERVLDADEQTMFVPWP